MLDRSIVGVVQIFDRQLDVPAVEAVAAAVGNEFAHDPDVVFARWGDEVSRTATINANDFGKGRPHASDYCLTDWLSCVWSPVNFVGAESTGRPSRRINRSRTK